jgi:hypothetical protein
MALLDKITFFENIFSQKDFEEIHKYILSPNWAFGHYSDENSAHKMFWNLDLSNIQYFNDYLFSVITQITNRNWKIERIYANGQTYGLDGSFHIDSDNGYTFLYYCNREWNPSWAGNTIFIDENTNQIESICPKPNHAILFPGNILHYGQSPSRDFYGLRVTIAYKLYPR